MGCRAILAAWVCVGLSMALPAQAAEDAGRAPETPAQHNARMQWWRDARFGMFIHWGLYAVIDGTYQGKPVEGAGEWVMHGGNIPVAEYEKFAAQFNPTKYDPARWVQIAKDAGMKYIVITSKHHDGFCLFKTSTTKYNVVDATPWGKDLLKPLAAECRRQGLKFCTYYSIMDWHHPAQTRANEKSYNPTKIVDGRKREYLDYMKGQLADLLKSCDPEVLWFDGEWPDWYTEADGREVYNYLLTLKPSLIVNNRVGKGRQDMAGMSKTADAAGDFGTPEQEIPANGLPGVDWESCMTMNDTWGFKTADQKWKSTEKLLHNLIDIASKGGNYLLNVGPTAQGEIPEASVERLAGMGRWMKPNGEAIYATQASPFAETPWGRCTQKTVDGHTRLYLELFTWPQDGKLTVAKLPGHATAAALLADGKSLKFSADGENLTLELPAAMPDKIATVVTVDLAK